MWLQGWRFSSIKERYSVLRLAVRRVPRRSGYLDANSKSLFLISWSCGEFCHKVTTARSRTKNARPGEPSSLRAFVAVSKAHRLLLATSLFDACSPFFQLLQSARPVFFEQA